MCGSIPAPAGTLCWNRNPTSRRPADLYFEGGDQYRGWFHTSLLTSRRRRRTARDRPSGWSAPPAGRSTSRAAPCRNRSATASIPVDIADRLGAEIVRLWVASVDFREDVVSSEQHHAAPRGKLPQAAQHVPLPAGESGRLRSGAGCDRRCGAAAARPLHAGPRRELAEKVGRHGWQRRLVRRLPVSPRLSGGQRILHRRSELRSIWTC